MTVILELEKKIKNIMVRKLHNKLSNMSYYKNYAASTGLVHNIANHEDAVKCIFEAENFTQFITKQSKETIHTWIQDPKTSINMPVNTFIHQPCGSQASPDFIIKFIDKSILAIECKTSSNGAFPMYNSGGVKSNYLYVFSSKNTNQTVLYMGYNIITSEQQKLIDEHIEEARIRDEILNKKLRECDTNHRGISYYTRPMITQNGGSSYTNYYTHVNRERDCNSVIEFMSK